MKKQDHQSAKSSLLVLIKSLEERAYMAKFMDAFLLLPYNIQTKLLEFVADECDRDDWSKWIEDDTLHLKVVRAILFFHTGREEIKQPSKKDLKKLIADFIRLGEKYSYWIEEEEFNFEEELRGIK